MTAEFSVVFDVSRDIYTSWMLSLVPLSYSIAWGILGWRLGDDPTKRRIAMYATLATGLIAGLIFSVGWTDYFRMRGAMARGEYRAVVGIVENFHGDTILGKSSETFSVDGHYFSFRGVGSSPSFHHSTGQGGPDLTGKCVRILFTDRREILWLGTSETACAHGDSHPRP